MLRLSAWRIAPQLDYRRLSSVVIKRNIAQATYQEIASCPPATCLCADMPPGLDIKMEGPMTMPPYSQHVIVYTGRADWPSKIERQNIPDTTINPAQMLKALLGKQGKYHNHEKPTLVTYSDQPPKSPDKTSAFVWPSYRVVHGIGNDENDWEDFLLKHVIKQAKGGASDQKQPVLYDCTEIFTPKTPRVLVCGHGNRDERCGILGPLLLKEFRKFTDKRSSPDIYCNVGTASISHIGGHAWAGNVIIYFPHGYQIPGKNLGENARAHPLSQMGVWYGRVQPKHVEGIVEQTLKRGIVINELLRGVHRTVNTKVQVD